MQARSTRGLPGWKRRKGCNSPTLRRGCIWKARKASRPDWIRSCPRSPGLLLEHPGEGPGSSAQDFVKARLVPVVLNYQFPDQPVVLLDVETKFQSFAELPRLDQVLILRLHPL